METSREPGILAQTATAFITSAAAVAGTLIVFELRDSTSRIRVALDELRDRVNVVREQVQEAWIQHVIDDLIEGSD